MKETEIKILGINREDVQRRLAELGARKRFDGDIHAFYYDFPDEILRNRGRTLRLRSEGEKAVLTLKEHRDNTAAKERMEYETEVVDFSAMQTILREIGFTPWLEMIKHRTSYEIDGTHFEIDRYRDVYHYIPEFLEIEGPDTETVFYYANALGFSRADCKPWDAVELAAHYKGSGAEEK